MLLIARPAVRCAGPEQDVKLLISDSRFFIRGFDLRGRFPGDRPFFNIPAELKVIEFDCSRKTGALAIRVDDHGFNHPKGES